MGMLAYSMRDPLVNIMTNDPAVIALTQQVMPILTLCYLGDGLNTVQGRRAWCRVVSAPSPHSHRVHTPSRDTSHCRNHAPPSSHPRCPVLSCRCYITWLWPVVGRCKHECVELVGDRRATRLLPGYCGGSQHAGAVGRLCNGGRGAEWPPGECTLATQSPCAHAIT